jgi:hypothetical protein
MRVGLLLGLLLLMAAQTGQGQESRRAYTLTLLSSISRLGGSPFESDDHLIEILELDSATGELGGGLALWGPEAPAYPRRAESPRWSFRGDWLAMSFYDREGRASLVAYEAETGDLALLIPPEAGFMQIGPVSWSPLNDELHFAATHATGQRELYRLTLPGGELESLGPGQAIAVDYEGQAPSTASLDSQGRPYLWEGERPLEGWFPEATGLAGSLDGQWLAITEATALSLVNLQTGAAIRLFDGPAFLGESATAFRQFELSSPAWAPNSQQVAFVLNAAGPGGPLSMVIEIMLPDGRAEVLAERRGGATPSADLRIFTGAAYQVRGAFLPDRPTGDEF